jgi:hypothetical protein
MGRKLAGPLHDQVVDYVRMQVDKWNVSVWCKRPPQELCRFLSFIVYVSKDVPSLWANKLATNPIFLSMCHNFPAMKQINIENKSPIGIWLNGDCTVKTIIVELRSVPALFDTFLYRGRNYTIGTWPNP